jgi:hypothetical protein
MHQYGHVHMDAPTEACPQRCICKHMSARMHLQRHGNTGVPEEACPQWHICMKEEGQILHA